MLKKNSTDTGVGGESSKVLCGRIKSYKLPEVMSLESASSGYYKFGKLERSKEADRPPL